jgi:fibronectin-binding autotransporter adhesin
MYLRPPVATGGTEPRSYSRVARTRFRAGRSYAAVLSILLLAASFAEAATITAKGGTGFLNRKQSWIGNRQPTSADIALWDSTSAATNAGLGSNASWLGIQIINPAGAVTFTAGNTLTLGSSGIDMSAATVDFTMNCGVALGVAQTWSVASSRTLTVGGVLSGSGALTKSGAGTVTLTGVNTFTGGVTINGGTVSVATTAALGSGSSAVTINPSGILQATGSFTTSRAAVLGGTGGASSGGTFDITGTNTMTRTGVISGTGSLIKTGTGTLSLSAANTFGGHTYVNGGTLSISNEQALGAQPTLGSSANAVHLANGTTLHSAISSTGNNRQIELVSGTATLDVGSSYTQQRNGLIYGAGGLVKAGAGTQILTNANTYTGGTLISAGTLQVNNTTGSGTGTASVTVHSGGTLSGLPTATGFSTAGRISGNVIVNSGGIVTARSGTTFTFGGLTLNASSIVNLQLGAPTTTALINITANNSFSIAGTSTINLSNVGGVTAGTYRLFDYSGNLTTFNNLALGSTPGGGFTYSLSHNQTGTSVDLLVSLSDQQWRSDISSNWSTAANWTSNAAPSGEGSQANFFGAIKQARTVTVDAAFTVGTMTFDSLHSYTIAGSNALTLNNGGTALITVMSGAHTISAPVTLANHLQISTNSGTSLTLSGALTGSASGWTLNSDGSGSVTFSGGTANTFTGLTTVAAGNLNLSKTAGVNAIGSGGLQVNAGASATLLASNQIADTGSVLVNGTLALGSSSETFAALNGLGAVTASAGSTLTIGASNNLDSQFDGTISGGGRLTKAGAGTLTLNGNNSYTGGTTINAGTVAITSGTSLGAVSGAATIGNATLQVASDVTSARNFVLASSGSKINPDAGATYTMSGTLSGTGTLNKSGDGILVLTGANTYTGGTIVNAGTVVVNSGSSLGNSSAAVQLNAGTLQVASGFTTTRNIALGSADSTVAVDAGQTYTVGSVVSGNGALNKAGAGTITLTGANTFTGATNIDGGVLIAAASSGTALGTTTGISVNNGGTLLLGASNQVNNSAAVTLAGGTISKGNFSEGSTSAAGFGALTLEANSVLDFGTGTVGTLTFASLAHDDTFRLIVNNWSGTAATLGSASTDRLIFASDQTANLSYFTFSGYGDGATQFRIGNTSFYEVVPMTPVPEPSTYAAAALTLLAILWQQRKRVQKLVRGARGWRAAAAKRRCRTPELQRPTCLVPAQRPG